MIKKILIVVFCFANYFGIAQTRFNKMYDFYGGGDQAKFIKEMPYGYIVLGTAIDSLNDGVLGVLRIDFDGNEIEKKIIKFDSLQFGLVNATFGVSDSSFFVIGTSKFPNLKITPHLVKLNKIGNMLWDKFILDTMINAQGWDIRQENNNDLIIIGNSDSLDLGGTDIAAFQMRTDSLGNLIYCRHYNVVTTYETFTSLDKTSDGGYIMGGTTYNYSTAFAKYFILKTDSLGYENWRKIFSDPYTSGGGVPRVIDTNLTILLGQYGGKPEYPVPPYNALYVPKIKWYYNDGISPQTRLYDTSYGYWNYFNDAVKLNSDTIVLGGTINNYGTGAKACLFFMSPNGDSLLCRRYDNSITYIDLMYDLIHCGDNGYALAGCNYPYMGLSQNFRVIKTDKFGCDTTNCQIYDNIDELIKISEYNYLRVWPNPAIEKIYIELTSAPKTLFFNTTINIYDLNGKRVVQNISNNQNGYTEINISELSRGVYFGEAYFHNTKLGHFKVVKG